MSQTETISRPTGHTAAGYNRRYCREERPADSLVIAGTHCMALAYSNANWHGLIVNGDSRLIQMQIRSLFDSNASWIEN